MTDFKNKKIGVVLAGCGVYDGSEIHEAVITLLALDDLPSPWPDTCTFFDTFRVTASARTS